MARSVIGQLGSRRGPINRGIEAEVPLMAQGVEGVDVVRGNWSVGGTLKTPAKDALSGADQNMRLTVSIQYTYLPQWGAKKQTQTSMFGWLLGMCEC